MPEPAAGTRLNDRYVLDGRIGLGGMSEVWRAADETLGRAVAVKILSGTAAEDPLLRAAIRREARAAARMTHPHAMRVYDYGEFPTGEAVLPYIVMELVEGATLADRLTDGPPLPWRAAARMAAEISAALADAHRLGVVHRDIKPANVMLTQSGAAKVLDFGIATLVNADSSPITGSFASGRTGGTEILDGWLAGTPPYAAPELLIKGEAGPPADVYAVGAVLYQALTGRLPLPITSWDEAAEVHRAGNAVPEPLPDSIPEALAATCLACLSRDPEARPVAGAIARIFGGYAAQAGEPAHPPTTVAPVSPAAGRPERQVSGAGAPGRFAPGAAEVPSFSVSPGFAASPGYSASPGFSSSPGYSSAPGSPAAPGGSVRGLIPFGDRDWAGRLRGRGGIGVFAGGLIVGGVGLVALAAMMFGPDREPVNSAPGVTTPAASTAPAQTRSASPAPSRTPSRTPSRPPSPEAENGEADVTGVLNRLDAALAQGLISRDINARAGTRLFNDLSQLRRDADDPEALSDGATELQERLEELADDGDVTEDAAANLSEIAEELRT
ncbi:protein kinase [Catenuloplanes sp. NPDC051500]|uniref:serine/threonine-protein kinase n=1 Tax=Catenuloplanes sp. NPDC051500 TaxID=3363959 RepID=UPI00378E888D